jgi:hypothetical protein
MFSTIMMLALSSLVSLPECVSPGDEIYGWMVTGAPAREWHFHAEECADLCGVIFPEQFASVPWCDPERQYIPPPRYRECVFNFDTVDGWNVMGETLGEREYAVWRGIGQPPALYKLREETTGFWPCPIFDDGFETGDLSRWTHTP